MQWANVFPISMRLQCAGRREWNGTRQKYSQDEDEDGDGSMKHLMNHHKGLLKQLTCLWLRLTLSLHLQLAICPLLLGRSWSFNQHKARCWINSNLLCLSLSLSLSLSLRGREMQLLAMQPDAIGIHSWGYTEGERGANKVSSLICLCDCKQLIHCCFPYAFQYNTWYQMPSVRARKVLSSFHVHLLVTVAVLFSYSLFLVCQTSLSLSLSLVE